MSDECEKCGNANYKAFKAIRLPRPMRDATAYQIECSCGHKWVKRKSMRTRHLPEERQREIAEFWGSVEYSDPIMDRIRERSRDRMTIEDDNFSEKGMLPNNVPSIEPMPSPTNGIFFHESKEEKVLKAALENKEPDLEMEKFMLPINPGPMYGGNDENG